MISLLALLFDPDFLFEGIPQLVRGSPELSDAAAQGSAELGQFARPENEERDHKNNDEFGHPDRAKHDRSLLFFTEYREG
jgi:hypothetical protein